MARDKGQKTFASNYEVKIAEMLDPRLLVDSKEELIKKETWPSDGDTLYMKEGMFVYVKGDGFYELISLTNILANDYSGWKKVTSGGEEGGSNVYVSDLLTEDDIMSIISGSAYQIEDTSKVEEFIANAKGKIVVFDGIVIPYIFLYEDGFEFTYCGVNIFNDELGIWYISYSGGEFTVNLSSQFSNYQPRLESGTNIKTINNTSILGSGNIGVQSPLVSGTNIKTINGESVLGGGNIYIPKNFLKQIGNIDSTKLIYSNRYNFLGYISSNITIELVEEEENELMPILHDFFCQFSYTSGSISFPSTIKWQNETVPTFKSGYTYQISIVNNLACFAEFKTA